MIVKFTETKDELLQILKIQNKNHLENVSIKTQKLKGFVTVRHNLKLLTKMNDKAKQIVATENGFVVGYALVMLKDFKKMIPVLMPMFNMFEEIYYKKKKLSSYNYYVMGQICVKESHRGKGISKKLYLGHKKNYSKEFEFCVTEVSTSNIPSMKAHKKVGFKIIHTFRDKTDEWNILLWDWK